MASGLYEAYETSKNAERDGVWVEDVGGARFLVSRMGGSNSKFQKALTAAMKPHLREIQLNIIDNEALEPVMRKVFIDTILLDWEFVTDREGAVLAFSKENAAKLFNDLPDLYSRLREQASNYTNFRASALKVASGN
jgi:hypothetical protein